MSLFNTESLNARAIHFKDITLRLLLGVNVALKHLRSYRDSAYL